MNAILSQLNKQGQPENVPGKVIAQERSKKTAVYEGAAPV